MWSHEEVERLREMARTMPMTEAARLLQRSVSGLSRKSSDLGILWDVHAGGGRRKKNILYRAWTQPEDNLLLDMAGNLSYSQAAAKLNRTFGEVVRRVKILGIRWVVAESSTRKIAEKLGVCPATVSQYKKRLGQRWRRNVNWGKPNQRCIMLAPRFDEIQAIAKALLEAPNSGPATSTLDYAKLKRIVHGEE